jgi:hypothetical protein
MVETIWGVGLFKPLDVDSKPTLATFLFNMFELSSMLLGQHAQIITGS